QAACLALDHGRTRRLLQSDGNLAARSHLLGDDRHRSDSYPVSRALLLPGRRPQAGQPQAHEGQHLQVLRLGVLSSCQVAALRLYHFGTVTAPRAADDTDAAYLANTPVL